MSERRRVAGREDASVTTVCGYCGVGCGMVLHLDAHARGGGRGVVRVSGRSDHPANHGRLCTKGATTAELLAAPGRLTKAAVRTGRAEALETMGVQEAIAHTARELRAIVDEHGPDAVAMYVSGQLTLEAQYLATKLAKGFLRTRHLESNSRLCMASAGSGYVQSLGADGPPGSYADIDHADLFLVTGANMADCHPVLFLRLMERVKAGAKLIVVDPRRTPTAARADLHLQVRPGTDLALLNGLLHLLVANGAVDEDFIAAHTQGWEHVVPLLADYDPAAVARITGVGEEELRTAAQWIAQAGNWVSCWTMGLNQSTHGTWNTNALCNLHLATGAICRTGSGPLSLTGQPNAMGGREMGYMGAGLPGQRSVADPADRAFVERAWGLRPGTIRSETSAGTIAMFEQLSAGTIRACWILGTNPVASVPHRATVVAGLERAELVVVHEPYDQTATLPFADVVLPAALWTEQEGVMVNSERTMTLCERATDPPGDALPDWELIARVATAMGYPGFDFATAAEVFDELSGFANARTGYDIGGVDHERLRRAPVQWPCPPGDQEDRHPIRYRTADGLRFPTPSGRAVFHARPHVPPRELPDDDFPFVLVTGRVAHQWHTMTKTGRVATLQRLEPAPFVEIHPEDAAAHTIDEGQYVRIVSRRGHAVVPARVTDVVPRGTCFAPFHWNDVFGPDLTINAVTHDAVDPVSLQPEIKACAVRLVPEGRRAEVAEPTVAAVNAGLVVGWASQTGTVEAAVPRVVDRLTGGGLEAAAVPLGRLDLAAVPRSSTVLVCASTTGDGEPPDAVRRWWARLCASDAPRLDGLRYAVVAFGDSSYADFCGFGRALDARLAELGAERLVPLSTCEREFATQLSDWTDDVTRVLGGRVVGPGAMSPGVGAPTGHARLVRNVRLTAPHSAKDVRHLGFRLPDGVDYRVGDALGVRPVNDPRAVERWLALTGVDGGAPYDDAVDWRTALLRRLDISGLSRPFLELIASRHPDVATLLEPRRGDDLRDWSWGRRMIEVLGRYPVRVDAPTWRGVLRPLAFRQYSISSSPLADPGEAQLTVSAVRWRDGGGLCSTFLADRCEDGAEVIVQPNERFRPPADPDVPVIMIGPGTGIAPFRAFLRDDRARGVRRRSWLFFGERHRGTDYLYREELEEFLADGTLTRLDLAFSRDQAAKVYVQHRMRERAAELWQWLADGARIYVCGDRESMARDVHLALREILAQQGRCDDEAAEELLDTWSAEGRYLRDVY